MRTSVPLPRTGDPRLDLWVPLLEEDPAIRTVTAAYSATELDSTILADASGGAFTVTLPPAAGCPGKELVVKRISASNTVTIDGSGAETIEGSATVSLSAQWAFRRLQSDGANWIILGST